MADEVDPLESLLTAHVNRMQEITSAGFAKSQQLCDQSLASIKKRTGVRTSALDKALESLGIVQLGLEPTDQP